MSKKRKRIFLNAIKVFHGMSGQKIKIGNQTFDAPFQGLPNPDQKKSSIENSFSFGNSTSLSAGATGLVVTLANIWTPAQNYFITGLFFSCLRIDNATSPFTFFNATCEVDLNQNGINAVPQGWNNSFSIASGTIRLHFVSGSLFLPLNIRLTANQPLSIVISISNWGGAALVTDSVSYRGVINYRY